MSETDGASTPGQVDDYASADNAGGSEMVSYPSGEGVLEVHMRERPDKKKRIQDMDGDEWKGTTCFRLYMLIWWLPAIAVFIYYSVGVASQYASDKTNPASTILINPLTRLPLPQVTICNWNQNGNFTDPQPETYCDICDLSIISCDYNITTDCLAKFAKRQYITDGGTFTCYEFNAFPNDIIYSDTTGYSGSFALVFRIKLPETTNPPSSRAGLQVSFQPSGQVTPEIVYDEDQFAPVGFDSFFGLQYITTVRYNLPFYDPNYNISTYEPDSTTVNLLGRAFRKGSNDTYAYVGVSFSFQTLSQKQVLFIAQYTLYSMFGDVSSMVGTLMGVDFIKFSVGAAFTYFSYKRPRVLFDLIADLNNG